MEQPGVTDIDFRSADQSLPGIRSPRLEAAHQKQVHHNIEIPGDGVAADTKSTRELRGIQHLALIVRKHLPITAKGFGRDAWTECRYVAFEVCLDKGCAPPKACFVIDGKEAVWKAPACPQTVHRRIFETGNFRERKWRELLICDSSGEAFRGLLQQVHRSRAEQKEMSRRPAFAAPLVDQAAQGLENPGKPVNFVEDHESILMLFQIEFRLCQFGPVGRQFQVQVKRFFPERLCQSHGKRRFAYLPGSKDGYSRKLFEQARYFGLNLPRNDHLAIMLQRFIFARLIERKRSKNPI